MKKLVKKSKLLFAVFLILLLIFVICTVYFLSPKSHEAVEKKTLVGVILPITGKAANMGSWVKEGVELAFEEIRKSNDGANIILVFEDSVCDPKMAVNAYYAVRSKGAKIIIGGGCSSETLAIAPIAEADKVVLFTPMSAADSISSSGDYVFRLHTKSSLDFSVFGRFVSKKYNKVAVLYDSTNEGFVQPANVFKNYFNGETILVPFISGSKDFRTELSKVNSSNVDAVLVLGLTPDSIALIKQMKELGVNKTILADKTIWSKDFITGVGELSEGIIFPVPKYDYNSNKSFWDKYYLVNRKEPSIYTAQGFDALMILNDSIKVCKEDTFCIKNYLYSLRDYPGAAGVLNFDSNGDALKEIAIMEIKNGSFQRIA